MMMHLIYPLELLQLFQPHQDSPPPLLLSDPELLAGLYCRSLITLTQLESILKGWLTRCLRRKSVCIVLISDYFTHNFQDKKCYVLVVAVSKVRGGE